MYPHLGQIVLFLIEIAKTQPKKWQRCNRGTSADGSTQQKQRIALCYCSYLSSILFTIASFFANLFHTLFSLRCVYFSSVAYSLAILIFNIWPELLYTNWQHVRALFFTSLFSFATPFWGLFTIFVVCQLYIYISIWVCVCVLHGCIFRECFELFQGHAIPKVSTHAWLQIHVYACRRLSIVCTHLCMYVFYTHTVYTHMIMYIHM